MHVHRSRLLPGSSAVLLWLFILLLLATLVAAALVAPSTPIYACENAITVIVGTDSGAGSLRQAVNDLCAGGTITFDNDYTITLDSTIDLNKNLTIDGRGHSIILDGNSSIGIFTVDSSADVTMQSLTLQNGSAGFAGGAIRNDGTLTVISSSFHNNHATNSNSYGGAIRNDGTLTVISSSFFANSANVSGGAIQSERTTTIINSRFSHNKAGSAGAIDDQGSTLTIHSSSFSANDGGGIRFSGTLHMANTIIAGSMVNSDCAGSITTSTNNWVEDGSCSPAHSGDPLFVDPDGADDTLGTADDDLRLQASSNAINAGDNAALPADSTDLDGDSDTSETIPFDLDGNSRIISGTVDIGAYEYLTLDTVSVSATDASGSETGPDGLSFTLTRIGSLSSALDVAVGISGTATNGSDYTPTLSNPVTFPAGEASTTIILTPVDDNVDETDETVSLEVQDGSGYLIDTGAASASGTIADNDSVGVRIGSTSLTVSEPDTSVTYTVTLESEPTAEVTIALASSDTGEATVSPSTLTFDATNWNTPQVVTVTGVDDSVDDGDQSVSISHTASGGGYDGVSIASVGVTVSDNDDPQPPVSNGTPNLKLDLTCPPHVAPGSKLICSLHYSNSGDGAATGVRLTAGVPAGTGFDAASSSSGWKPLGNTTATHQQMTSVYVYEVGTVDPQSSGEVSFAVQVGTDVAPDTTVSMSTSLEHDAAEAGSTVKKNVSDSVLVAFYRVCFPLIVLRS